ncbi:class I SAM-dependent methyltransferase [Cellvibrio sp. QJXJ]|uniref:class I SAM-dependent methyltransferase n=1 Tax=Cellvibrio sp. QJXJ TaxID=2964606 RepID=UPI0021C2CCC7|nr:class I SAM-dependent methyltransferase [Cellvibrio sp. QJXJ]UUA72073.1 class I SAM-dependent methyltransferase [Cellvibrio sp. QJXJ]
MAMTEGTKGYERFIPLFIESAQTLDFHQSCKDYLHFLPAVPASILDIGSGAGQNAAALAHLGYDVAAVEPMPEFMHAAMYKYEALPVLWMQGSLPELACLESQDTLFDFILIEGVWHHLNEQERAISVARLSAILKLGGRCAISLRNGPAGMGTRVYPTDVFSTIKAFECFGFEVLFCVENQPSIFSFKENVTWSRVVLQREASK